MCHHLPSPPPSSNGGDDNSNNNNNSNDIVENAIQRRLDALHELLPHRPEVRHLIDSHLIASWVSAGSPPPEYVLRPADSYHYNNLPDIIPTLRGCLIYNQWEADILGVLMSPFCLHINRALKPHHLAPSTRTSRVCAINILHGLLMGLYPYNMRQPCYERRVAIAGWLRCAVCSSPANQMEFLRRNGGLLSLAMTEYLVNVLSDHCPVEERLLIKLPQCRFIVNHICDAMRSEVDKCPLDELNERVAATLTSVQRQLKICNSRPCKRTAVRTPCRKIDPLDIKEALDTQLVPLGSVNMVAQIQILRPDVSFSQIQIMEHVWNSISVHPLPRSMLKVQLDVIESRGACQRLQKALKFVHICMRCAMGSKSTLSQHRCSFDCISGELKCTFCGGGMQSICLLGRVLRIRDTNYILCPSCLSPTAWRYSIEPLGGPDNAARCDRCRPKQCPAQRQCAACDSRVITMHRQIVDWENLQMITVPLCHRHARSCIASLEVTYDMAALGADVLAITSEKASLRRGRSCSRRV